MKKTKNNSYNSTPFSSKENICPNARFSTISIANKATKKQFTPSIGTDSQFSVFNTINVQRPSQQNSEATKSRVDMQAILENFSSKKSVTERSIEYTNKSFLALLGFALGKEGISVGEAIDKCEQYEITCKDQLISILQEKEPTRQWPLPLSNLLLTDLGHLKVMQICDHLQREEDLNDSELQIVEFLLPNTNHIQALNRTVFLDFYNDFRSRIDEKFNIVDDLVKIYTLQVQPKIKKIKDKILLIKIEKKIRKYDKLNNGLITFPELTTCLEALPLNQDEMLTIFKYYYFIENDRMMSIVDRRQTVRCSTCIKEIFDKQDEPLMRDTVSTVQLYETQNKNIINQLLKDKHYLLETIQNKDEEMGQLTNEIALLQLELEKREREFQAEKAREVEKTKIKYLEMIKMLKEDNEAKDKTIQWYKNQLQAVATQNSHEVIIKTRQNIFQKASKNPQPPSHISSEQQSDY